MSEPVLEPLPATLPGDEDIPEAIAEVVKSDEAPRPEFQFTPAQERLMGDLGAKMRLVGLIGIVAGVLMILGLVTDLSIRGLAALTTLSVTPLVFILIGAWTRAAGREFADVAATRQRDVTHLMSALEYQDRIFRFALWLTGALVVLTVLGAIYSVAMSGGG